MLRSIVARGLDRVGYTVVRKEALYSEDGLWTLHNCDFRDDLAFRAAYARGVRAAGADYNWRWRVHIGLWAAATAAELEGDFVECGVNRGFLSSAIMEFLDWDRLGKNFWLLDTFDGIDESILAGEELASVQARDHSNPFYVRGAEEVQANFAEWKNVRMIVGSVPGTLNQVSAGRIAYLALDMNASAPEIEALKFLWARLVPGAIVLLDDYAYEGFPEQHKAWRAFAADRGLRLASLPTGQGLLIKTSTD
jgi:hypothetical protein